MLLLLAAWFTFQPPRQKEFCLHDKRSTQQKAVLPGSNLRPIPTINQNSINVIDTNSREIMENIRIIHQLRLYTLYHYLIATLTYLRKIYISPKRIAYNLVPLEMQSLCWRIQIVFQLFLVCGSAVMWSSQHQCKGRLMRVLCCEKVKSPTMCVTRLVDLNYFL